MFARSVADRSTAPLQGSLLAVGEPSLPDGVGPLERIDLGGGAWIDRQPNWLPGSDAWFDRLAAGLAWQSASRPMYERIVEVPRLIWNGTASNHPSTRAEQDREIGAALNADLLALSELLSSHYQRPLLRVGANWYRSGSDSVAPHADRVRRPGDAVVVIVSVGAARMLTLRSASTTPGTAETHRFPLGRGDVLVMGGTTQALFHHGIAKSSACGARISVMFREPGSSTRT